MQSFSPGASSGFSIVNQVETSSRAIVSPTEGLTVLSLLNSESPGQPQQPYPAIPNPHANPVDRPTSGLHTFVYQQPPGAPVLWPLDHEQEAMLLRHYLDHVALFVCGSVLDVLHTTNASSLI